MFVQPTCNERKYDSDDIDSGIDNNHDILMMEIMVTIILGTLSKDDDDDDGSENVGKKMNLRSFKLNRVFGPAQYVTCRLLFLELNP